jgi:aminoglycoside/choline kinase family phosphotransferase
MTDTRIPETAAAIDAAWMEAALRAGGLDTTAHVVAVHPEVVNEAVGLMGEITRFRLEWDEPGDGRPDRVIAKLPSALPENRELALAMGYYEFEHRFYTEVADGCSMRTPRVWYSTGDAGSGRYALLIEDLGELERVDQMDGADLDHAAAVVDALADLHAQWWASPQLGDHPWLPDGLGDEVRVYGDLCRGSWTAFAEATSQVITEDDRALAERFLERYDTMIDRSLDAPHTLVHRDFRIDNMHFDDGRPVVFDWGSVGHGGGLYDYAYFVAGSTTIETRRAHGDDLLARYRSRLAAAGIEADDTTFGEWHDVGALFCLVVPILAGGSVLDTRDEKGEALIAEGLRRLFSYLHDHESVRFLA